MSTYCPLIKKNCIEHRCAWYTHISGTDPQTGNTVDKWGCTIAFIPMMQIEQTKATIATQAATVDVRENITKAAAAQIRATLSQAVLPAEVTVDPNPNE